MTTTVDVEGVRTRLWRSMMRELQTGGGLALLDLAGRDTARRHGDVAEIRRLAGLVQDDARVAPERAARRLTRAGLPRTVLDLGAGLAPWSSALAALSETISVVALDLPAQRDALAEAVLATTRAGQFQVAAADAFRDALGTGYDLVIIANVCHLFPDGRNRLLLARAAAALATGGVLAVIDQILDLDPDWPTWAALYAVGLPHGMPGGYLYTSDEYAAWLREAGLVPTSTSALSAPPSLTLLEARRPR